MSRCFFLELYHMIPEALNRTTRNVSNIIGFQVLMVIHILYLGGLSWDMVEFEPKHQIVRKTRSCFPCLRPTWGVCEAHLLQACEPCVIKAMPPQAYGNVWWWSPKLAIGGKWGSSLPLEQCACTPWKILGQTLVPLKIFDFHFILKLDKLDYFVGLSRGVCQPFYFSRFYANLKKFWISMKCRKIFFLQTPLLWPSK